MKNLSNNLIEATIFTGKYVEENVIIPKIPLVLLDYHFQLKRLQYPARVCYAMTINKAQERSLEMAGMDLRANCFSHGQLCVASSRVSSSNNLVILQPEKKNQ